MNQEKSFNLGKSIKYWSDKETKFLPSSRYEKRFQNQLHAVPKYISNFTFNSSLAESGSITGLKERECGQIGVKSMHGTFGCTCIPNYRLEDT